MTMPPASWPRRAVPVRLARVNMPLMSDLYDNDILLWSERQAELLRQHAAGARENDAIDWPNINAEVEDVGRNTLRACRSQLLQALLHDLKAKAWPRSRDVPQWRSEARVTRINAADAYAPSMHKRIDVPGIYSDACPVTLDELLSDE
jgi:hypothetical protein